MPTMHSKKIGYQDPLSSSHNVPTKSEDRLELQSKTIRVRQGHFENLKDNSMLMR